MFRRLFCDPPAQGAEPKIGKGADPNSIHKMPNRGLGGRGVFLVAKGEIQTQRLVHLKPTMGGGGSGEVMLLHAAVTGSSVELRTWFGHSRVFGNPSFGCPEGRSR